MGSRSSGVDPTALDPGSVLIDGDRIVAVGPVAELDADPRAATATVVDATGHAVLPGLHNSHLHSGLLRGTAESMSLWDWLQAYVDPAHRALTPEIAATASLHCYAESAARRHHVGDGHVAVHGGFRRRSPTTVGIRATLVPYVADEDGYDYFESIESNRRLLETHREAADGRVRTWVGLEHLFYCRPQCFRDAARARRGVRHRDPHPLVGVDLGGAGVAQAVRPSTDRGLPPPRHPHRAHRRRTLRVARRP